MLCLLCVFNSILKRLSSAISCGGGVSYFFVCTMEIESSGGWVPCIPLDEDGVCWPQDFTFFFPLRGRPFIIFWSVYSDILHFPCLLTCTVQFLTTFFPAPHCLHEWSSLSPEHFDSFPQIQNFTGTIN